MSENAHAFEVVADDDLQTLMRVLSPFVVAGARVTALTLTPGAAGESLLWIEVADLDRQAASLVTARIANVCSVRKVQAGPARRSAPSLAQQPLVLPD